MEFAHCKLYYYQFYLLLLFYLLYLKTIYYQEAIKLIIEFPKEVYNKNI